jgi:hypothetical protein
MITDQMILGHEICITWDYYKNPGIRILIPGRIRHTQLLLSPLKQHAGSYFLKNIMPIMAKVGGVFGL